MSKPLKKLAGKEVAILAFLESQMQLKFADLAEKAAWLTDREWEILHEMSVGVKNRDIAAKLGISSKTNDIHRANISKKLGVHSMNEYGRVLWLLKLGNALCPEVLEAARAAKAAS